MSMSQQQTVLQMPEKLLIFYVKWWQNCIIISKCCSSVIEPDQENFESVLMEDDMFTADDQEGMKIRFP